MTEVSFSVPTDFINTILQAMLGQGYINNISIGLTCLLLGYIFLSYKFVVKGKNSIKWRSISQLDKLVISFFIGFAFILVGIETLIIFLQINKIITGTQTFNFLGITSEHVIFGSIFIYAFLLIYPIKIMKLKGKDIFEEIEKTFEYLYRLLFLLFAFISLLLFNFQGFIGFVIFILVYYWFFYLLPKKKINEKNIRASKTKF